MRISVPVDVSEPFCRALCNPRHVCDPSHYFTCSECERTFCAAFGAADEYFDACDDCAAVLHAERSEG